MDAATSKSQATFLNDAYKIWNAAPTEIKNSKTLAIAYFFLVDFQTPYIVMIQPSILAWTTDKKNTILYYYLFCFDFRFGLFKGAYHPALLIPNNNWQ